MRRLRETADLSQRAVAKALGCQVPKVSLMENGKRPLQEGDLKTLLEVFDVPDDDHQQYFDELQNAHERGWWEFYDEDTVADWYADFIGLEQGAERIRAYQSAVIHGLLQTPAYATALYQDPIARLNEEKVARLVDVRRRRQRVLRGDGDLRRLAVVLDEAALRHVAGDSRVMREQLDHVVELCESNDRIAVRIVPFDRGGGASAAAYGPFTMFKFTFETDPGLVYKELVSGSVFLDSLPELDKHSMMFERLSELALPPEESLAMLRASAKEYGRSR
jgi:transcriptional regulator with XRE-family HTH domain